MSATVEQYHWTNALVGTLDAGWHLSDAEQIVAMELVRKLLDFLNIPSRGPARILPAAVAMEVDGGYFTIQLNSHHDSNTQRPIRAARAEDLTVGPHVWRDSMVSMIETAYPDLDPMERVAAHAVFEQLLVGMGSSKRAPTHLPDMVVRASKNF